MRKVFISLILLLLFFVPMTASAYFFADAIISEVAPQNIIEGNSVNGILKINAACNFQDKKDFKASVNYGGSEGSESLGSCPCKTDSSEIKRVVCDFNFSHQYNTVGQYLITPTVDWTTGGFGVGSRPGAPAKVNVFEAPTLPTSTGHATTDNPLSTSTVAGLVKTVTNVVYIIAYMLTVLFIMLGGFMIITSSGNPEQITRGRKIVLYTIIAFAILIAARGIINLIFIIFDIPTRI